MRNKLNQFCHDLALFALMFALVHAEDRTPVALSETDADNLVLIGEIEKQIAHEDKVNKLESANIVESLVIDKEGAQLKMNRVKAERIRQANRSLSSAVAPSAMPNPETLAQLIETAKTLKRHAWLLSATVYDDGAFTELKWKEEGRDYHAFSKVNFHDFVGTASFRVDDKDYTLIMTIGDTSSEDVRVRNLRLAEAGEELKWLPSEKDFSSRDFIIVSEASEKAIETLNDVHSYYKEHAESLRLTAGNVRALNSARERYEALNPPVKKDEVINFWKKK